MIQTLVIVMTLATTQRDCTAVIIILYEGQKSKRSILGRCLRHGQIEWKIDIITFKLKQLLGT